MQYIRTEEGEEVTLRGIRDVQFAYFNDSDGFTQAYKLDYIRDLESIKERVQERLPEPVQESDKLASDYISITEDDNYTCFHHMHPSRPIRVRIIIDDVTILDIILPSGFTQKIPLYTGSRTLRQSIYTRMEAEFID